MNLVNLLKKILKISFGAISLKNIKESCKFEAEHEFIEKLPNKYETLIGENGIRLSGGEKQRLSIARAMLKKSSIILLDEATSSLDAESEEIVQNAINNLIEPKTVGTDSYKEIEASLDNLPILTHQTTDGGPYIASAMAVAHDEEHGRNISFHRAMKIDSKRMVMRILDRHLKEYMDRGLKEFAYCNGVSVPVLLGSATSFEIESDEMAVANALADSPVIEVGGHMVPQSEVVMICEFTGELHLSLIHI